MKKYILVLFLVLFIVPSIAFASWWNPFSWSWFSLFNKNNNSSQTQQNNDTKQTSNIDQTTTPASSYNTKSEIEALQKQITDLKNQKSNSDSIKKKNTVIPAPAPTPTLSLTPAHEPVSPISTPVPQIATQNSGEANTQANNQTTEAKQLFVNQLYTIQTNFINNCLNNLSQALAQEQMAVNNGDSSDSTYHLYTDTVTTECTATQTNATSILLSPVVLPTTYTDAANNMAQAAYYIIKSIIAMRPIQPSQQTVQAIQNAQTQFNYNSSFVRTYENESKNYDDQVVKFLTSPQ